MLCSLPRACRMIGDISVRRVAGKLHFAVHQQSFVDVLPQVRVRCAAAELLAQPWLCNAAQHSQKELRLGHAPATKCAIYWLC